MCFGYYKVKLKIGSCNGMCSKVFKIKDNEGYNLMLNRMKLGGVEGEGGLSLRDYVLTKHFSLGEKGGPNRIRDKSSFC